MCGGVWWGRLCGCRCALLLRPPERSPFSLLAQWKLCRVLQQSTTTKGTPFIATHDGRTIRYADPIIKVGDTVKVDIKTGKVIEVAKFEAGCSVMITKGRNTGRVGTVLARDRHPGSFDIVHVKDAAGNVFATRLGNAFVVGKAGASECFVQLPRGGGVKKDILAQRKTTA